MPHCMSPEDRLKRREDLLREKNRIERLMKENRVKYNKLLAAVGRSPEAAKPESPPASPKQDNKKTEKHKAPSKKEHNLVKRMLAQQDKHAKHQCMMGTQQLEKNAKEFNAFNARRPNYENLRECGKCQQALPAPKRASLDNQRRQNLVRGNNKPLNNVPRAQAAPAQRIVSLRGFDIGDIDFVEEPDDPVPGPAGQVDANDIYNYELDPEDSLPARNPRATEPAIENLGIHLLDDIEAYGR